MWQFHTCSVLFLLFIVVQHLYYALYCGSVKHFNLFWDCSPGTCLSASWHLQTRWLICWGWFMKGHFKSGGEMLSSLKTILVNLISLLVIYLFINLGRWCEIRSHKRGLIPSKWSKKWEIIEMLFNLSKGHCENQMLDMSDGVQLHSTWNRTKRHSVFFLLLAECWLTSESSFSFLLTPNNHVTPGWLTRLGTLTRSWRFPLTVSCWEVKHAASQNEHPSVQLRHIRSSPAAAAVFTLTLTTACRVCVCVCEMFWVLLNLFLLWKCGWGLMR